MSFHTVRPGTRLNIAWLWWRADRGGVGIREMIALVAVAVTIVAAVAAGLEVAGVDVADWLREQFTD